MCSLYVLTGLFRPAPDMTRGEVLKYAVAYALMRSRKIIRGLKEGLTEYVVADQVVAQLKDHGDAWHVNEEQPTAKAPST
jgi:hypothetical protein